MNVVLPGIGGIATVGITVIAESVAAEVTESGTAKETMGAGAIVGETIVVAGTVTEATGMVIAGMAGTDTGMAEATVIATAGARTGETR